MNRGHDVGLEYQDGRCIIAPVRGMGTITYSVSSSEGDKQAGDDAMEGTMQRVQLHAEMNRGGVARLEAGRHRRGLIVGMILALALTACGLPGPGETATPPSIIETFPPLMSATSAATPTALPPTPTAPAEATSAATLPAGTPTSLAEGLTVSLGTPDPNPNCPEHYPWFFENPANECADFIHNTWTVLQPFEHGLMVWSQDRGQTWVLLDAGEPFKPYVLVSDPLGLPLPGPDASIVPPEGLLQPELGFALYWRGLVPGTEWVRAALGWATAPETAYSAFWQCNTNTGSAARCYFNGPRDEIIVMTAGDVLYWTYFQTAVR